MNDEMNKPSVFDGAGEIEQTVGQDAVENLQDKVEAATGKMQAIDAVEFMKKVRTKPIVRDYPKIGRNDKCPCGSGLKYKKCCLRTGKYETVHQVA